MKIKKPETKKSQLNSTKSYLSVLSEFLLKLENVEQFSVTMHGARIRDIERYSCKIEVGGNRLKGQLKK